MTTGRPAPPSRVPTLTEVVSLPQTPAAPEVAPAPTAAAALEAPAGPPLIERRADWPPIQEEQIVQRVFAALQRQIDLMLETRMRETLTPVLNRMGDALVRDLRHELASTLRDVVAHAVAQELTRHRER